MNTKIIAQARVAIEAAEKRIDELEAALESERVKAKLEREGSAKLLEFVRGARKERCDRRSHAGTCDGLQTSRPAGVHTDHRWDHLGDRGRHAARRGTRRRLAEALTTE